MRKILFIILAMTIHMYCHCQDIISLAGQWNFCIDSLNVGESEKWFDCNLKNRITLPGITDEAGYGSEVLEKGKLTRLHKYIGKAWYQTNIHIPASWEGKSVDLFLERVMWRSDLWVDGKPVGHSSSLSTPHVYSLGKLAPGSHRLTLRIDNSEIFPIGNLWSHSYGDQTQIIWNGILGRMELSAHPDIRFSSVRIFPSMEGKAKVEFSLCNMTGTTNRVSVALQIKEKKTRKIVYEHTFVYEVLSGMNECHKELRVESPLTWDEFSPKMYVMDCVLKSDKGSDIYPSIDFGFRTLSKDSDYIILNGIPRFLRGNLDCAVFPLKGYPPTEKSEWLRIFKNYKDYGLNHIRFHSWTPPEAAFEAADELGLYILCEIFWRDGWMGKGLDVKAVSPFILSELFNISNYYGNHPSFVMQAIGNELGGFNIAELDTLITQVKEYDNRRLYLTSVRRPATRHADVNIQGDLSSPYPLIFVNNGQFSTDWDYGKWYGVASSLPSIQHEVGQWVFYPDWKSIDKYTGLLRPRDLEKFKEDAIRNGVFNQNADFVKSSGNQSLSLYKENIESFLRTPKCGGFQLLGMQDFTGQGVALVGWLDAFYDNKGLVSPETFRQWCDTIVPLIRTSSYCLESSDTLKAEIDMFHFALRDLKNKNVKWSLIDKERGNIFASGTFRSCNIDNADLTKIGSISVPLNAVTKAKNLILSVALDGTPHKNSWNFWVFPNSEKLSLKGENVIETHNPDSAICYMKKGYKVLLWAYGLGNGRNEKLAQWVPVFWNGGEAKDEGSVNGALIQKNHPALSGFPTDMHLDYQWYDICKGGKAFILNNSVSASYPIVQPIHDFHFNRKLGTIMEFKGENGGKILICGYNLIDEIDKRPEALTLRNSLYSYVMSDQFNPKDFIDYDWIKSQIQCSSSNIMAPSQFKNAYLYVKAGARADIQMNRKEIPWNIEYDGVMYSSDFYGYNVGCEKLVRNDDLECYWSGKTLIFDFKVPFDYNGYIKIHIDPDLNEVESLKLYCNEREYSVKNNIDENGWISFKLQSGETLFSKIVVKVISKSDKCLVDELVLIK